MTNKEWLDYLAQNAPDELAVWFDAEHVETEERALDGDTEPENEDSRDKLEADVRNFAEKSGWLYPMAGTRIVLEWLDRQAAITEEQTRCKWVIASADEIAAWRSKAEKLKAQVYELTAERGKIAELVGWRGEVDGNSGRPLLVPMVAAMCEGSEVAEKLRVRVEELTAERDKLQELNEYHALQYELASEDADRLQAQVDELFKENDALVEERSNLQKQLRFTSAEREHYRSMCSNMATKIHDALMVMDEGMA